MQAGGERRGWSVGELARASGVTIRALRYYDEIGLVPASERTRAGHRRYTDTDVRRLYRVRALHQLGLSLAEIGNVLNAPEDPAALRHLLAAQLADLDARAAGIAEQRGRVQALLDQVDGPGMPEPGQFLAVLETTVPLVDANAFLTARQREALVLRGREMGDDAVGVLKAEWLGLVGQLRELLHDDFSDLEPLREIVGDARVVAIGEGGHRVHEFYQVRHRLTRFLVAELGFTAFVMESGFPEGLAVDEWIAGGPGDLDELLRHGITYNMGRCAEMRDQLEWLRSYNATHDRQVRFYGMDPSDSSASALPSIKIVAAYLDKVDPAYAESVRGRLLPLFDYLPADRTGLAWAAPALYAYMALEPAVRYEMTARIGALVERMQAMRLIYTGRSDHETFEMTYRCAVTGRHTDAFLQVFALGDERTYEGSNIRDAAMAENIEWILQREQRVVIGAANGHVQRWPFSAPPIVNDKLTVLGEHLAAALGDQLVVIANSFGGGELFLHKPIPDGPPGHTETFVEEMPPLDPASLDELLATAGMPRYVLDLRKVPPSGPVADRFAAVSSIMTGGQATPVNPMAAFDAVVYVDKVSPWHFLGQGY